MAEPQVVIPVPAEVVRVAIQEQVVEVVCSLQKAEEGQNVLAGWRGWRRPCPPTCAVRVHVLLHTSLHSTSGSSSGGMFLGNRHVLTLIFLFDFLWRGY